MQVQSLLLQQRDMTLIEAIQILDRIVSLVQMSRAEHTRALEATQVLTEFIKKDKDGKDS